MSELEAALLFQLKAAQVPEPEQQWRFDPQRKFRFDLAWPGHKIGVEVDGATWVAGRHTRGLGFERDCEKLNLAALHGYRVFRFTGTMVNDGRALATLEQALEGK
jgi:very-short-patch-repair endonuclease